MTNTNSNALSPESLLEHASWAHALARSLVGEAAAADLVQETWVAALEASPTTDRPLRPWLGTVLGNFARQRARSASRRTQREEQAAALEAQPSAAELTERAESQRLLMEQLLELDEDLREVLLLRYFEELSAAEIGRRKGIPASTVKSRLQRGLEQMRESLGARFEGGRESWSLALLPLLRVSSQRGALVVPSAGTFGWMSLVKLALWLVMGTLGAIGLALLVMIGLPLLESIPVEHVTFEALEPPTAAALPVATPLESDRLAVEAPQKPDAAPVELPVAATALHTDLRVRFLDSTGQGVAGVQLASLWGGSPSGPKSDANGRLQYAFDSRHLNMEGSLRYFHPFLASDVLSFNQTPGSVLDLGDIHVRPGGALTGRVVDGLGAPLAQAEVRVRGASVSSSAGGGMTSHRSTQLGQADTKTDENGEFRLTGLLAGNVRVGVDALRGLYEAESGWVEIRAGQESQGLVIVVPETPPDERIEGHVFDPEGKPLAGVNVNSSYRSFFRSGSRGVTTRKDGSFRIVTAVDTGHDMVFTPPSRFDWAPVVLDDVDPGQIQLRIQFEQAELFQLTIQDDLRDPVLHFGCTVYDADEENVLQYVPEASHEAGRVSLRLPASGFVVRVEASGFAIETIAMGRGQLEAGENLTLSVGRLPGLTGRVTSGGVPVAGAKLYLQRRATSKVTYNGFPVRFKSRKVESTESSEDGSFYLDLRDPGLYVVRAVAPGFAPFEVGPLQLSTLGGARDLKFPLTGGGAIHGQVLLDPGMNPAGKIVAISRGDCWAQTTRVGPDGFFHFENLIPGPWLVQITDEDLTGGGSSSSRDSFASPHDETPSNCLVVEGATTRHDLVLSPLPVCILKGQLDLVGLDMSSWSGQLDASHANGGGTRVVGSNFALDQDGRFEVHVAGDGDWRLGLAGDDSEGLRFLVPVTLTEGENQWSARVELAEVRLQGVLPGPCFYLWEGPEGLKGVWPLEYDGRTDWTLAPVPAGTARLVNRDGRFGPTDPSRWPTWMELDLAVGAKEDLDLP